MCTLAVSLSKAEMISSPVTSLIFTNNCGNFRPSACIVYAPALNHVLSSIASHLIVFYHFISVLSAIHSLCLKWHSSLFARHPPSSGSPYQDYPSFTLYAAPLSSDPPQSIQILVLNHFPISINYKLQKRKEGSLKCVLYYAVYTVAAHLVFNSSILSE